MIAFLSRLPAGTVALLVATSLTAAACDVEQTESGELPDVDVDVDAGDLPAYDVDWADVNVGTRTTTVEVPQVIVVMEEEQVEVPFVDVDMPNAGAKEERTITAEVELEEERHELEIEEVYGTGERLIVVSRLTPTGESLGDETIRVSDRIVLNAPELDVRHYIVGERPEGEWNRQYTFVADRSQIENRLEGATRIYPR